MASFASLSTKGAWIPPSVRAVLVSTRPWSVPASLVPAALAAAIVYRDAHSLVDVILPVVAGMAVHLGANTTNTIYDFKKGVDKKETADDRALVDGTVTIGTVRTISIICYALAAAICGYYGYILGPALGGLALLGFVLGFFYTADPFSLKYLGLGDVVIFLCFGPLLMTCTAAAATHKVELHPHVALMSIPMGLLTSAILHANNTRDVKADKAAGARTVAQLLGFTNSFRLYVALFAAAYALTAYALATILAGWAGVSVDSVVAVYTSQPPLALLRLALAPSAAAAGSATPGPAIAVALQLARGVAVLVVATLPWCLSLIRRFSNRALATLPQSTAQFNLLFGACVMCALLPFEAFARLYLGILFYLGGVNNILMWQHTRLLVHQKLCNIVPGLPMALTSVLGLGASFTQMAASAVFILGGPFARESAAILLAFLFPVTVAVHDFYNTGFDEQSEIRKGGWAEDVGSGRRAAAPKKVEEEVQQEQEKDAVSKAGVAASTPARKRAGSTSSGSTAATSASRKRAAPAAAPIVREADADADAAHAPSSSSAGASVPTFLRDFDNEFVHFFKNVQILGGLLVYLAYAPAAE
jgi:1,4-dihydroxy-2-naphthoate octaprenyltransferase